MLKSVLFLSLSALLTSAFKVKLSSDGKAEFESGFKEITVENMMTEFMDKEQIIGEWLTFFDNPKLCKGSSCKDGLAEVKKLDRQLQGKLRIARVNCALTKEVCKILGVKVGASPKLIFFTPDKKAFQYEGPIKAAKIKETFISEDHGYRNHKLFSENTDETVLQGISQLAGTGNND